MLTLTTSLALFVSSIFAQDFSELSEPTSQSNDKGGDGFKTFEEICYENGFDFE